MLTTNTVTQSMSCGGNSLILQNSKLSTKTFNIMLPFSFYARIKDLLNKLYSCVVRHKSMCNEKLIYFRLTNPKIIPSYLYWHLRQDFNDGEVHNMDNKDFIGIYQLSRHLIYVRNTFTPLLELGVFVKKSRQANLSIGRYPRNYGQVSLINSDYLGKLR